MHHLVEAIDEAAVSIRKEIESMQWQHSMAQQFIRSNGGNFEYVL
jgi:hypothetical protein